MKEIIKKQKTLIIAQELDKFFNVVAFNDVKDIFIKYGIDKFDPIKIQQLINYLAAELADRTIKMF